MSKICSACKQKKPLEEFGRCAANKDGLQYSCKACHLKWYERYRKDGRYADYHKRYNQRPEVKARKRAYAKTEKMLVWSKAYKKEYHQRYYQRPEVRKRMNEYSRKYNKTPKAKLTQKRWKQRLSSRVKSSQYVYNLKVQALDILGGPVCSNTKCLVSGGCTDVRTLQFDHIYGRDGETRGNFTSLCRWIIDNPIEARAKYQVLCANCNIIKKFERENEGIRHSPLKQVIFVGHKR